MGLSRQECWSDLPFLCPVDHILSELSTMTCSNWVALQGMVHSFIELEKAVIHVISLVNFCDCGFHSVFIWWMSIRGLWKLHDGRNWLLGKLGLALVGRTVLSTSLIQLSVMGGAVFPLCSLAWGQTVLVVKVVMVISFKRTYANRLRLPGLL